MKIKYVVVAAATGLALTVSGCSSDSSTASQAPETQTSEVAPADAQTSEASTDETEPIETPAVENMTATAIADAIKAEVPEISEVVTITEDNDPNDKIGRPGGYVDGAVMFDSRAEPTGEEPGADQGAFLEVWPDEASATDRSEFIQGVLEDADGLFGTEYHYQHDGFLLRVTGVIKPSEAQAYEAAFNAQF